jgi:hypothetical protein
MPEKFRLHIIKRVIQFVLPALIAMACNESITPEPPAADGLFFPLQTGLYREYSVRQINYTNVGTIDTNVFFLREAVVDSFENAEGNFTYILHLSSRKNMDEAWELDSVWTARKTESQAIQTEENVAFVKMLFPISNDRSWDGNVLNTLEREDYRYDSVGISREINGLIFDSTVVVVQNDFADGFVMDDIRREFFASNVGLIYRQRLILEYCTTPECLETPEQEIDIGIDYVQKIIAYGLE